MKYLPHFLLMVLMSHAAAGAAPPLPPTTIDVQATTFKVTDPALMISLLNASATGDEALFARLLGMVQDGTADLISDDRLTALSGKAPELQAIREQPFPGGYFSTGHPGEVMPNGYEYKNCGTELHAKLVLTPSSTPDRTAPQLCGTLDVSSVQGDQLSPWPVSLPGQAADGHLDYVQFQHLSTTARFRYADGAWHLLSAIQYHPEVDGNIWSYCLTFGKAKPRSAEKPKPEAVIQPLLRLHALTFQLSLASGRELLRARENQGERWLLDKLLAETAAGTAELNQQSITHVDPRLVFKMQNTQEDPFSGAIRHEAVPETSKELPNEEGEPFAFSSTPRDGTSKVEAIREFVYPTEYEDDFRPRSTEAKNVGHSFGATVVHSGAAGVTKVFVEVEHIRMPLLRAFPASSGARIPQVHFPAPLSSRITTTVGVRSGGTYLLGAISLPDFFKETHAATPQMEITLMQVSATSPVPGSQQPVKQKELECELVSVEAKEAMTLKSIRKSSEAAKALLEEAIQSGRAHPVSFCLLPNPATEGAGLKAVFEVPGPTRAHWTKNHILLPNDFEFLTAGTEMEGSRAPSFKHTFFPYILGIDTDAMLAAANGDGTIPQPRDFRWECTRLPTASGIHLSAPEPIKVPAGHSEEGRWQVMIVRRRE